MHFKCVSSKDILMRVIAQNLPPESTLIEKVFVVFFWLFILHVGGG